MDNKKLLILPQPNKVEVVSDEQFVFSEQVSINEKFKCEFCLEELKKIVDTYLKMSIVSYSSNSYIKGKINLVMEEDENLPTEGYILDISRDTICIKGSSEQGVFYGIVTLGRIIAQYGKTLPAFHIEDSPRFGYRAFMLDVGRYFYTVEEVKRFIDIMATLKLNYFHWHLTEDQGWRIEIKKYPELTVKGSKRTHTNFNCKPHSGFYTQEEIKQVVEYAHKKYIKVIPEIDMPGHMQAAIACYPELACFNRKLPVATHWGVKHDILCAGKAETMQFIKDVLTEVMGLFPDGYIHLGGDEAVKMRWNICPHCTAKIKELGLNNADELQACMINEVAEFLKEKGFKTIIWNEHNISGLCNKDIIWQYYSANNPKTNESLIKMAKEANEGREIINCLSSAYYLDLPYNTIPLTIAYDNEPIADMVNLPENIIGVEGALWTEYVPDMNKALRMTFPRLYAIAETAWSQKENKNYDEFIAKIPIFNEYINSIYLDVKLRTVEDANPKKFKGFFEEKWFGRRVLHWQGLHNLIDDAKVEKMAKKLKKS